MYLIAVGHLCFLFYYIQDRNLFVKACIELHENIQVIVRLSFFWTNQYNAYMFY